MTGLACDFWLLRVVREYSNRGLSVKYWRFNNSMLVIWTLSTWFYWIKITANCVGIRPAFVD
jgi:hypothetical protein